MPRKQLLNDKLPPKVIKQWPEILSEIKVVYIPLKYVNTMVISFVNGKDIFIDVDKAKDTNPDTEGVEQSLKNFLKHYNDSIVDIDFSINIEKIKNDVENFTKSFLHEKP